MKLLTSFLLFASLQVAAKVYPQAITLSFKNAPLQKVLNEVTRQTGISFLWDEAFMDNSIKVTIQVKRATLEQVLESCFKNTQLTYVVSGKIVVVKVKEKPATSLQAERPPTVITGRVTDNNGEPLPGVTVFAKESGKTVITDQEGKFTIEVNEQDKVLQFTYVGMEKQEMVIAGKTNVQVQLKAVNTSLSDVVVVGYGTQRKANLTGAVATVNSSELTKAPVATPANALAGRLPGLIAIQPSGMPGSDAANLSIRGYGNALVIVDGVEMDFRFIDPNQIESVSILKDASASIFGSRAGNGVILVTTKRGNNQKPTLAFNTSKTLQGITIMPKPVSSGQYAELAREAHLQAGKPEATAPFTEEQVEKYYAGDDPLFPNTDWYNELIRKWAPQQQHNLSVRGGSENIKYYGFLGYLEQKTLFKNNGGDYKRYNFQSNIDAKMADNLSLQLTVAGIVEDRDFPQNSLYSGEASAWGYFWNTLPIYPARFPDPSKIPFADGNGTGGAHVVSNSEVSGYNNTDGVNLRGSMALNYQFKFVEGLSAKAFVTYAGNFISNKVFVKPVTLYTYDPASDVYTVAGSYGSKASLNAREDKNRTLTAQYSLNYDRTFGGRHHITALALYEVIDFKSSFIGAARRDFITSAIDQMYAGSTVGASNDGSASEMGRQSYVGRLNYAFNNKYLFETVFRADASAKFPPNARWGYFPGVSVGWRISDENFMQPVSFIDQLKIRASYGEAGNDAVGNFQYLAGYRINPLPYILGDGPQQAITPNGIANPYMTWEQTQSWNGGIDFSLLGRKIYGQLDLFYRKRSGILATRAATLPFSFGATLPPENLNSLNDRGFELELGTAGRKGDWQWDIRGNVSWSRARWDHFEEPDYTDPDQLRLNKQSGTWTDRQIGYVAEGLFTSQEEIDHLGYDQDQQGNITLRPGDVRIKNTNGDKVIDWRDQVEIGKGTIPHWMLGLSTDLRYKNFDFSALFQGALGYYTYITFSQGKNYSSFVYDERWTPENNNPHALVPRLGGANTNNYYTDARYRKADYVRLKTVTLGYNVPKKMLNNIKVKQVRVFIAGTNLLTIDGLHKYDIDPEAPTSEAGRYYPQQKTISFGATLSF